jgi:hypothetical protein
MSILIAFSQVMGTIPSNTSDTAKYPSFMKSTMEVLKHFMFDVVEGADLECLVPHNFLDLFWAQVGLTLGAIVLVTLCHQVIIKMTCIQRRLDAETYDTYRDMLVKWFFFAMTIWHPNVSRTALLLLQCQTIGYSSYLTTDTSIDCNSLAYRVAFVFDVIFIIFIVAGWLVFLLWYLWRVRRLFTSSHLNLDESGELYDEASQKAIMALKMVQVWIPLTTTGSGDDVRNATEQVTSTVATLERLRDRLSVPKGILTRQLSPLVKSARSQSTPSPWHVRDPVEPPAVPLDDLPCDAGPEHGIPFPRTISNLDTNGKAARMHLKIKFLYEYYRPSCIYWVVGETVRKFVLIAGLTFFPGGLIKLVFATWVSVLSLIVFLICTPFIRRELNLLQGSCLTIIWLSFQNSILLHVNIFSNNRSSLEFLVGTGIASLLSGTAIVVITLPFLVGVTLQREWMGRNQWQSILRCVYAVVVLCSAETNHSMIRVCVCVCERVCVCLCVCE